MKKLLLILCLAFCCLTGCSKELDVLETKFFEIPLHDNKYCRLEIPADWTLDEQNGLNYWSFNNGEAIIFKLETVSDFGEKVDKTVYSTYSVARAFDDKDSIVINVDKQQLNTIGALLNRSEVIEREVLQFKELGIEYLPLYEEVEMVLTENNLYMPVGYDFVDNQTYTYAHYIKDGTFLSSWTMKYKLEDLKPYLHNLVTCNNSSTELVAWYETDDMYVAWSSNKIVAAKKLTYNLWCCYVGSTGTDAYVSQAMLNIKYI